MKKDNLAFIDLETTGLDPTRHEIIEVAGIIVRQTARAGRGAELQVIEEFEMKVKPAHIETAEPEALRINGYNEADWLFAGDLEQAMKLVSEKTDGCLPVGQNVRFDLAFLEAAFKQTDVPNKMTFPSVDVISIAFAKLYDDERIQKFGLWSLCEYFGIKNNRAHSALSDIRVTLEIYKKLLKA